MARHKHKKVQAKANAPPKRPRKSYDTPERECAHADSGCCPSCADPMKVRVHKGFTLESVAHS